MVECVRPRIRPSQIKDILKTCSVENKKVDKMKVLTKSSYFLVDLVNKNGDDFVRDLYELLLIDRMNEEPSKRLGPTVPDDVVSKIESISHIVEETTSEEFRVPAILRVALDLYLLSLKEEKVTDNVST